MSYASKRKKSNPGSFFADHEGSVHEVEMDMESSIEENEGGDYALEFQTNIEPNQTIIEDILAEKNTIVYNSKFE